MKKLLVLMAIAIIMATGVFAATSVDGDGTVPSSDKAKINVTLGLTGGEGSSIYRTGFTSAAVTPSAPTATPLAEENFALTINTTDWTAANAEDSLYAYWFILSNQNVKVFLTIPAAGLTATDTNNGTIAWTNVTLTPVSGSESVNTTTFPGEDEKIIRNNFATELASSIEIATHNGSEEVQSVGSVGLEFQVSNLANKKPDTYSAAITLEVKTV